MGKLDVGRKRKQHWKQAGQEQQRQTFKRTTQQRIKKSIKASEKINGTTLTTWSNKLKKLQDKET